MVELDDGLQFVGRVISVLDRVDGLIGNAGQIAGAVVGIDDRGRVGISRHPPDHRDESAMNKPPAQVLLIIHFMDLCHPHYLRV